MCSQSPEWSEPIHAEASCPLCQSELLLRHGQYGRFWGCAQFPQCDFKKKVGQAHEENRHALPGHECPECQAPLAMKAGRYGWFVGCTAFPHCEYHTDVSAQEAQAPKCPECCEGTLTERINRQGKRFFACTAYPDCRYSVKHEPVARVCAECSGSVMLKRSNAQGAFLQCPQKQCGHREFLAESLKESLDG